MSLQILSLALLVLESCYVHTQALNQDHSAFPLSPCSVLM